MTLFTELADTALELLTELGQDIIITRPTSAYNAATRSVSPSPAISQTLKGTTEPQRGKRLNDSMALKFERTATCAPAPVAGTSFEPQVGDTVDDAGQLWVIGEGGVAIERRQGVAILYTIGLNRA